MTTDVSYILPILQYLLEKVKIFLKMIACLAEIVAFEPFFHFNILVANGSHPPHPRSYPEFNTEWMSKRETLLSHWSGDSLVQDTKR